MKLFVFIVPLIVVQGCWMSSSSETRDKVTTRTYSETVAPDGSKTGQETIRSHEEATAETKSGVDPAQVQGMIQVALKAALATTGLGGLPIGEIVTSGLALLGGGTALIKHAESKRNKRESDMHKADAIAARSKLVPKE